MMDVTPASPARSFLLQWLPALLLILVAALAALGLEERITYHAGFGWDGVEYGRIAAQLAGGGQPVAEAPFVYRIGTPWLASLLGGDNLLQGFFLVNFTAALVAPILLFLWLLGFPIRRDTRLLLLATFLFTWHTPLRFTVFYPAYVDPVMWVLWLGGLLALRATPLRPGPAWLSAWMLFAAVAAAFREVLLLLPLMLPLRQIDPLELLRARPAWRGLRSWITARLRISSIAPLLTGLLLLVLIQAWARATNDYGFARTAVLWTYQKGLPHMLHGALLAFGPLVLLCAGGTLFRVRLSAFGRDVFPGLLLPALIMFAWVGGSDTERILYWAAPLLLVLAGIGIDRLRATGGGLLLLAVMLGAEVIGQRWFWAIPDHPSDATTPLPLLGFWTDQMQYLDLYSFHGERRLQALSLAQYLLLAAGLGWWQWRLLRGKGKSDSQTPAEP